MSDEVKRFVFHETPGHGYLEVPLDFLRELEISQLISGYSYMGENALTGKMMVYCEEDCDMGIVCTRMELDGIKFEIDDEYEDEEDEPFEVEDLTNLQFPSWDELIGSLHRPHH